jgi:Ca-activated chloride channel family protein
MKYFGSKLAIAGCLLSLSLAGAARAQALFLPMEEREAADRKAAIASRPHPPIDPVRPTPPPSNLPFRVTNSAINVRIDENIATTSMEQTFLNQTGRDLEVRVLIPLPAGAAINNSALSMNDQMVEGKLYNAQQAQSIYESIVNQRRDPALLRFAGENLYEARVFPIPPNQERKLRFSYTQVLTPTGGLYDFRHILAGSQMYKDGVEKFSFDCTIHSKSRIGPVYSPSHQVSVQRPDENTATIKLSGANMSSDADFKLYYSPSTEDVAMRVIAHRNSDTEDGYFMLIGRVDEQLEKSKILPKEVVFVVDTSGSMQGEKIEQTKKALKFCLSSLSESDRFNLITFSTDVNGLSSGNMLEASKANVAKALTAVDQIEASGGTNIDGALRAALGSDFTAGSTKAKMVVFMTDGLPTVGVTDPQSILGDAVAASQKNKVRVFNFGVGNDVNTHLLDKLSLQAEGVSTYVSPREDIEVKVSDFYSKIKNPVMTDVVFDFGSASLANSIYPKKIPALYRGGEITILGRFKGTGPAEITLSGNVAGEPRTIKLPVTWPGRDIGNSQLPRVWAMRKIGHLLEDVRLHGENQEMIKEIVELSQRHGIVTPYTSQLVLEPGMEQNWRNRPGDMPVANGRNRGVFGDRDGGGAQPPAPAAAAPADALRMQEAVAKKAEAAAKSVGETARRENVGETANALARVEQELKDAKQSAAADQGAFDDANKRKEVQERRTLAGFALKADKAFDERRAGKAGEEKNLAESLERAEAATLKQVGARTFYNRGGVWVDSTAKSDVKPTIIKLFSKEYFDLLKSDTTLGPVLAMSGKILVVVDTKLYQIEE